MLRASTLLIVLSLAIPTLGGCAAAPFVPADADEDAEPSGDAVTIASSGESRFTTTANLNFRQGPSKSESIMRVLPRGTAVTRILRTPQNGFFKVTQDGDEGWVHGNYIRAAGAGGDDEDTPATPTDTGGTGTGQIESCKASFYDEGQQTANGERFDPSAMTAAHKTLRFNTRVRVTNKANGKSVTVRINDRGPFVAGRCIDLSRGAFTTISSTSAGVASVTVEVLR